MARGDSIRELDEQMAALVRRAVDDLRVQMRRRLEEATAELQQRLGEAAPELPESFISEDHIQRIAQEVAGPSPEAVEEARSAGEAAGRAGAHGALRAALADLDRARSQSDVLGALLSASAGYAQRAAILLLRDGTLSGWGARGFEGGDGAVRSVSLGGDREPWAGLAAGGPARVLASAGSAGLVSQLDSPLADEAYAVPMVLRDRVAAVAYVDRADGSGPLDVDAVQVLTYAAALALETLAFREREQTATLRPAERPADGEAASAAEAAATAAAVTEATVSGTTPVDWTPLHSAGSAAEEPAAAGDGVLDLEAPDEDGPVAVEDEPDVYDLTVEPELELEDAALEDVTLEDAEDAEAPTEIDTEIEVDELPPEEALAFQDEPGEIPTRTYDYPREVEGDDDEAAALLDDTQVEETLEPPRSAETVAWSPQAVPPVEDEAEDEAEEEVEAKEEPEAAVEGEDAEAVEVDERPEAGAVPPPAPTPPSAAGPVEPPADVEGPGFAFSSATKSPVSEDEEAAHEEARRLARLLVSEIQLYNQDEVEEGRRNRDIYERLRDDIDRSRQLYEERVEAGVRESTDYFYQELVRQLAAGDAKALGI
jgi:hypothetical protein